MWNNYFYQIQTKYSMRLSLKKPLVIRLDGKGVTRNSKINIIERYEGSFLCAMEETARYFSNKYHCLCIWGSDEISFIVDNPENVINDLEPTDKSNYSNEIIAMFSQYYFNYFNYIYKGNKIFWHGKCFSINQEKKISYIKYRSKIIENVLVTYFLKKENEKIDDKLELRIEKAKTLRNYSKLEKIKNGILYYDGYEINFDDYINGGKINRLKEDKDVKVELIDF